MATAPARTPSAPQAALSATVAGASAAIFARRMIIAFGLPVATAVYVQASRAFQRRLRSSEATLEAAKLTCTLENDDDGAQLPPAPRPHVL